MTELKVVSFEIGEETYAIDIMKIDNVSEMMAIMKLPGMSLNIKGVAKLRNEIIPIIDTGKKFNIQQNDSATTERIIVVYIRDKKVGLMVEKVKQVITINSDQLEIPPKTNQIENRYIKHIAKLENEMLMIVDLKNLFNDSEIDELNQLVDR